MNSWKYSPHIDIDSAIIRQDWLESSFCLLSVSFIHDACSGIPRNNQKIRKLITFKRSFFRSYVSHLKNQYFHSYFWWNHCEVLAWVKTRLSDYFEDLYYSNSATIQKKIFTDVHIHSEKIDNVTTYIKFRVKVYYFPSTIVNDQGKIYSQRNNVITRTFLVPRFWSDIHEVYLWYFEELKELLIHIYSE